MTNFQTSVAASSDDAQQSNATMDLTGTTLQLTAADRWIGVLFTNVTIPNAATIDDANVDFEVGSASFDDVVATIYGNDVDSASTFTTTNNDISSRALTDANVSWNVTSLGTGIKSTPDIKSIIQEIVNRAGWSSGNSIAILFDGGTSTNLRCASFDHALQAAPLLNVNYTVSGAAGQPMAARGRLIPGMRKSHGHQGW